MVKLPVVEGVIAPKLALPPEMEHTAFKFAQTSRELAWVSANELEHNKIKGDNNMFS